MPWKLRVPVGFRGWRAFCAGRAAESAGECGRGRDCRRLCARGRDKRWDGRDHGKRRAGGDGKRRTSGGGLELELVNAAHGMDPDYVPVLAEVERGYQVDIRMEEPLREMLQDARRRALRADLFRLPHMGEAGEPVRSQGGGIPGGRDGGEGGQGDGSQDSGCAGNERTPAGGWR